MRRRPATLPLFTCVLLLLVGRAVCAAETADRLIRMVGKDVGLCLEIGRLDATLTAFEHGEFFKRLERSAVYAEWLASGQHRRVELIKATVERFSGRPFREYIREIFGTSVVVAVYPVSAAEMSAVLLSQAVSSDVLRTGIDAWNRAEPQRTEAISFAGRTYYKRSCAAAPGRAINTLFYCQIDRTFVLSDREDLVRRSLTLDAATDSSSSLVDSPAFEKARQSLSPKSAARAYVNPRAWDDVLGVAKGESAGQSLLIPVWRRCDWMAFGLQTDRGVVMEAVVHFSTAAVSERWMRFVDSMSGPADFLRLVPSDALVVLAGRQAFGDFLRHALPAASGDQERRPWDSFRQVSRGLLLGLDLVDDVLPAFGENWGAYVVPRNDSDTDGLPFDGLVAIELPSAKTPGRAREQETAAANAVQKNQNGRTPPAVRDAVDNGLNTCLNFVAAYFNVNTADKPAVVRTESRNGTLVRWLDSIGPYHPGYGLTARFLVIGTSPQAIRNFADADAADKSVLRDRSPIADVAGAYFPTENQVLFVNTAAIRKFLDRHGPELVQHAIRSRSLAPLDAEQTLRRFLDVSGLFDAIFVAGRIGDTTVRLVVGGVANVRPDGEPAAPATAKSPAAPLREPARPNGRE